MTMRILARLLFSFLMSVACLLATTAVKDQSTIKEEDRSADSAAIRRHIESIFQAFIDGDIDKIHATHSEDWRGFLEGSQVPIKGIDEYMRANGIDWPRPANAAKLSPYLPAGTTYKVSDFDVNFYSPELAVASFFGEFQNKTGNTTVTLRRFRIMDVYAKRNGGWIQVASHTVIDPDWRAAQASKPLTVTPQIRQQILTARENIWKAWFANDRATLERLIPEEVIAINVGEDNWSDRATILAEAQSFADSKAKLVRLEFPKTEMQVYGNTIIIYTDYLYETEADGKRMTVTGRGTEMFVRRGNDLVNVGWHLDRGK